MNTDRLCKLAVDALEDLKAENVTVLDVRTLTDVTDWMIIATGRSDRHVRSLGENVVEQAKKHGQQPLGVEGLETGQWALIDLCDVVVHVMTKDARDLYQLEKLWTAPPATARRRRTVET